MEIIPVLLDDCVLFPMPLCDTLLRAAEANLYNVQFSQQILDGATRNLVKKGRMTELKASRFQAMIKSYFPKAMVEVPAELVDTMTNHPDDRHVVAAAILVRAKIIVTFNLKHFPAKALAPWGIEAQHPDVFLTYLYESFPNAMVKLIRQQSQDLKNPPLSVAELLDKLSNQVPVFARKVQLNQQNIEN